MYQAPLLSNGEYNTALKIINQSEFHPDTRLEVVRCRFCHAQGAQRNEAGEILGNLAFNLVKFVGWTVHPKTKEPMCGRCKTEADNVG